MVAQALLTERLKPTLIIDQISYLCIITRPQLKLGRH